MASLRILKNLFIKDFEEFFQQYDVPRRTVRIEALSTAHKFGKVKEMIEEELREVDKKFTAENLDDMLFEKLYYSNNNYQFILKYDSFFASESTDRKTIVEQLKANTSLKFNHPVLSMKEDDEINLCTCRAEFSSRDTLKYIHLLIKFETIDFKYGKTDVFCGVTIDVHHELVLLKFNYKHFEELAEEPLKTVKNVCEMLSGVGRAGKDLLPLNLNVIQLEEDSSLSTIYSLFAELTEEAEDILDTYVKEGTEDKIHQFLKDELGIEDIKDEYIEQIKVVMYQDISKKMDEFIFKKGWVFRFQFREADHTRASSNQEKRLPVYSTKSFWQLKELIHKEQELHEAGIHWNLSETSGDENFVDVRIESRNGTIILHYYYNMRVGRKEKEEYVLRKIGSNL